MSDRDRNDLRADQKYFTRPLLQASIAGGSDALGGLVAGALLPPAAVGAPPTGGASAALPILAGLGTSVVSSMTLNYGVDTLTDHVPFARSIIGDWDQ